MLTVYLFGVAISLVCWCSLAFPQNLSEFISVLLLSFMWPALIVVFLFLYVISLEF